MIPKIGIGIIVLKGNEIILGKRKGAHGEGKWAPPGGHLRFGEEPEACAQRELLEETGLIITDFRRIGFTNNIFPEQNQHYVSLFLIGKWATGEPQCLEKDKCEGWQWFEWGNFPSPLFLPLQTFVNTNAFPNRL